MFHKQIDYAEFNEQVSFFISNGPEFLRTKYFSQYDMSHIIWLIKITVGSSKKYIASVPLCYPTSL